jgi:hypothetical protein
LPGICHPLLLSCLLLLGGCATQTFDLLQKPEAGLPRRAEVSSTPFHPQERYQCGPATLAMALGAAGFKVEPDALVSQVYVPQREGSFAPEMLAATRRNGALAMTIPPRMTALLTEVAAGNPVVVLENLSLPIIPVWHYAIVIGYDLDRQEVVLRSGTIERLPMSMSTFEHTWARGDYWGMVALAPGRLPATAEEGATANALVDLERALGAVRVRPGWNAALKRWPQNLTLQMGSGNAAYAAGDRDAALAAFRKTTQDHPDSAPAFNNLASVLADAGQLDAAEIAAQKAVALGGPFRETALATLSEIETRRNKGGK